MSDLFGNIIRAPCTAPLLDESLFGTTGGYQAGRYCGTGSFMRGDIEASCCFPCPLQDWLYTPEWQSHLALSNYLSVLSLVLCSFLLLSFLVLPSAQSHRHYLSIGLLIPVLLISLSFAIPVSTKPDFCYDAITPRDMHSSMSCAWTGSFVTLGGLGCVIWVFLRSLWLFVRIVYDVAPGRKFMFGSIAAGTLLPVVFLVAVLSSTGFSYRMGQTCLPNHESAITTFWVWLVLFAGLGFILQAMTTSYCVWVYAKTLKLARAAPANTRGYSGGQTKQANLRTWANIKKLFILQWRNILVAVFVLIGSLVFFIVFWTQDRKLGNVFNDPENLKPVRTWIICQTLSGGDKKECRKYVSDFTVNQMAVVTSLILASLVGIEIFILLFRVSMFHAWIALFRTLLSKTPFNRPPSPELTSFDNPEKFSIASPRADQNTFQDVETLSLADSTANRSGSRFIEDFNAPPPPHYSVANLASPRSSAPLPMTPMAPTPPPKSPLPIPPVQVSDPARTYQPLSLFTPPPSPTTPAPFHYDPPTTPIRPARPPSIFLISPAPHLAKVQILAAPPPSPRSLHSPKRRSFQHHNHNHHNHKHVFFPSTYTSHARVTYTPTRPAPRSPRRKGSNPRSVVSCLTCVSQSRTRSWRDSTISALERIGEGYCEDCGEGDEDGDGDAEGEGNGVIGRVM